MNPAWTYKPTAWAIASDGIVYGVGCTRIDAERDSRRWIRVPEAGLPEPIPCSEAARAMVEDNGGDFPGLFVCEAYVCTQAEEAGGIQ